MQHCCQCLEADASDRLVQDQRIVLLREISCVLLVVHTRMRPRISMTRLPRRLRAVPLAVIASN
jgi:hypothetical protein